MINKRAIERALKECAFDPKKTGPLAVVLDVNNTDYYLNRSIELIKEALIYPERYDENIKRTIQLLIWSKIKEGGKAATEDARQNH